MAQDFYAYLNFRCFVEIENVLCKGFPVWRHAIDLSWALLVPSSGESYVFPHLFRIRTTFRTPLVPIEGVVDTLSLIDESVATCMYFRPSVQRIPASTHAGLVEASVFFLGLSGIHRRVICIAKNVL